MAVYEGRRTIDGIVVTRDGQPIDQRLDVKQYTVHGLEWGYEGDPPRQLALALLAEHLDDAQAALARVEPFMRQVVADLDNDWTLTSEDIDGFLATAGESQAVGHV